MPKQPRQDQPGMRAPGGGNPKSSGKGGGKSDSRGAQVDTAGSATVRGEQPSPSARRRGQTSVADRT